jgi:thymidine phosphorylase
MTSHALRLKRLGIDTYQAAVVYMRSDCHICQAEGFAAQSRVRVLLGGRSLSATLNVVHGDLLRSGEAALSESAWVALGATEGNMCHVTHPEPVASESRLRAKVYGEKLSDADMRLIVGDIVQNRYSELQLAAFVTAIAGGRLDFAETLALTKAMVGAGERIRWSYPVVADKHCVGGLPGNRTTPIVVAIVAALGLPFPKTSSRAITSPAGTADTMEVLAPVDLDLPAMRRVVEQEGGCVVWGGAVNLSPADDVLIRVERPLDFDSDGQLVASVLSKKAAAGATHVLIDVPIGPTAKIRSEPAAEALGLRLRDVAAALGLNVRVMWSDGTQPVGRGIGPALEARDVLAVLRGDIGAPPDLRDRSLALAAGVLELCGAATEEHGRVMAENALVSGRASKKFEAICAAQGGMREPPIAALCRPIEAEQGGVVSSIDNRGLARAAKLAGAPNDKTAGAEIHVRLGDTVERGQPLFTLHAGAPGQMEYAMSFLQTRSPVVSIVSAA